MAFAVILAAPVVLIIAMGPALVTFGAAAVLVEKLGLYKYQPVMDAGYTIGRGLLWANKASKGKFGGLICLLVFSAWGYVLTTIGLLPALKASWEVVVYLIVTVTSWVASALMELAVRVC